MDNFAGKKILILGSFAAMLDVVEYANQAGAYTICADYYDDSPCKRIAAEAWDVSTVDLDALETMARNAEIDGVFASHGDFNIANAANLAKRLGLPFYTSAESARMTMDKEEFWSICHDNGVLVPKRYEPCDEEAFSEPEGIEYPVIVKPVDNSGGRGISICYDRDELESACKVAHASSKQGRIVIEQLLQGNEVSVSYAMQDGTSVCTSVHDRYLMSVGDGTMQLPLAYVYPSQQTDLFLKNDDEAVRRMLAAAGANNGACFIQGFIQGEHVAFYEMGYRLGGSRQYQILEAENNANTMHALLRYSLTGRMFFGDEMSRFDPRFKSSYCTLWLMGKPGTIKEIRGIQAVKSMPETIATNQWLVPGEGVQEKDWGTLSQTVFEVALHAADRQHLAEAINRVYEVFDIIGEDGSSLLLGRLNTDELFVNRLEA